MDDKHIGLDNIKCPGCGELIPISEAISHQIAERMRNELKANSVRQQKALSAREKAVKEQEDALEATVQGRLQAATVDIEKQAEQKARATLLVEIEDLKRQGVEKDAKLSAFQESELEVRKLKRELKEKEKTIDLELQRKLAVEGERIKAEATKEVRDAVTLELRDLKDQAAEKDRKLAAAAESELELR